ncbi:hypothetical protein POX_d05130 [Penicillium oxalicum]|uniref:hypothetical protein n=1 Tax=Penicillium oxalicum TaxID=69781 RepID=UPI0020B789B9|nr:hypothetical protein POX_d05130 [Penicillium oxalicum]KAI2789635.1 hypothetical protein POX_d05130 [Penicillium oxalicum]
MRVPIPHYCQVESLDEDFSDAVQAGLFAITTDFRARSKPEAWSFESTAWASGTPRRSLIVTREIGDIATLKWPAEAPSRGDGKPTPGCANFMVSPS